MTGNDFRTVARYARFLSPGNQTLSRPGSWKAADADRLALTRQQESIEPESTPRSGLFATLAERRLSQHAPLEFLHSESGISPMTGNPYASPEDVSITPTKEKQPRFTLFELLVVISIIAVLIGLLLPLRRSAGSAGRRQQCKNNLQQIGLALHNYADQYGALPPAYTVDAAGKPLHSWRTLILPYLEQQELFKKIDLSKPWNDPANAEAFKTAPAAYRCPGATLPPNYTSYLGIVGVNACFHPTEPRAFSEISDGLSNTLMVFEVAQKLAVHWMAPLDANAEMVLSFKSDGNIGHDGGTQVALADGSVRFISENVSPETRHALISIAGNEQVGEY